MHLHVKSITSSLALDSFRLPGPLSLRNYTKTLLWTLALVGVCTIFTGLEKYVAAPAGWIPSDKNYRMFREPTEVPMRLLGLSHYGVALLFLLSSRRVRSLRGVACVAGLTAAGWLICRLFDLAGAHTSALALILFYFYFLVHEFRDDLFFCQVYGDMPAADSQSRDRTMSVLFWVSIGLLLSVMLPAAATYGAFRPHYGHPVLQAMFPAEWPPAVWFVSTIIPTAAVAGAALLKLSRRFPDRLSGLWHRHRPILIIYLVYAAIILPAAVFQTWTLQIVVLMHFVGWYLFGRYQLETQPAPQRGPGLWPWLRRTTNGFTCLHFGLAGLMMLLALTSVYAYGRNTSLELLVGSKYFYYWTIMHVTLSFFPRQGFPPRT